MMRVVKQGLVCEKIRSKNVADFELTPFTCGNKESRCVEAPVWIKGIQI